MQINDDDDDDDDDDMEQFHHFGTVFAKEDRETRKVVQKPCLFMRQSRSVQLESRAASATLSRDSGALVRQNRRCDVGLSRRSSLVWIWCADERRLSRTVASRCVSIVPPARTPPYQICAPPPAAGGVPMGNGPSAGGPEFQAEHFLTVFSLQ